MKDKDELSVSLNQSWYSTHGGLLTHLFGVSRKINQDKNIHGLMVIIANHKGGFKAKALKI